MTDLTLFQQKIAELLQNIEYRFEEPLSKHTSFKIGGAAEVMVFPKTPDELAAVLKATELLNCEPLILGAGTNILAPDVGIRGLVICLKDALRRAGTDAVVMTAVPMAPLASVYSSEAAISALESGKVVIFGAGLGIPFLSTDTTGAVRAAEIGAEAMFMAKNIDYIYTADPRKDPTAKKLTRVKASEVLAMNLGAIDATATAFCLSGGMPIHVFGLGEPEDIIRALRGERVGTVVTAE